MFSAQLKVMISIFFLAITLTACGVKGSPLPPETEAEKTLREDAEAKKAAKSSNTNSQTAPAKK